MGCRRVGVHLRHVGYLAPSLKGQGTVMAGAKESVSSGQRVLHTNACTRMQSFSCIRAGAGTLRREWRASGLVVAAISVSDSDGGIQMLRVPGSYFSPPSQR